MSEHLKLDYLLIEPIAEPDSILLGATLNPDISLVHINGRAHSLNSVVRKILLVQTKHQVENPLSQELANLRSKIMKLKPVQNALIIAS